MTDKQKRIADFERRVREIEPPFEVDKILIDGKFWFYILIHPTSDDARLLKELGIGPKDCHYVGCYLRSLDDVFFLEVVISQNDEHRPVGLYARWDLKNSPPMLYLYAVVRETEISKELVQSIIIKYSKIDLGEFKGPDKLLLVGKVE